MNRGNREVKGRCWLCPFLVVYVKAHHFPATWKYVIHTRPGIQMWLPKSPGILTTCSPRLIFSSDPEAFDCLCRCPGKNPCFHLQRVILLCFWPCPPLSLKDGWLSCHSWYCSGAGLSCLHILTARLSSSFLRLQELLDLEIWSPGCQLPLRVYPCPSHLTSLSLVVL